MEFLLIFALAYAADKAIQHVRKRMGESRSERIAEGMKKFPGMSAARRKRMAARHDTGWLASEVLHGFPVTRTGWHAGWLSHKTAAVHQKAIRDEARRTHADVQDSLREAVGKEADQNVTAITGAAGGSDLTRKQTADTLAKVIPITAAKGASEGVSEEGSQEAVPEAPEPGPYAPQATSPDAEPAAPGITHCQACGHEGRPGDELVTKEPEGWKVHQSHFKDPDSGFYEPPADEDGWPSGIPHKRKSDPAATEGAGMPATDDYSTINGMGTGRARPGNADATYDQSIAAAKQIISECDQEIARLRTHRLGNLVDSLSGMSLDSGSLGRAAEIEDGLRAQQKAAQQTLDSAQAFHDGLQRDHGAVNEAHQSAPQGGAEREFYQS